MTEQRETLRVGEVYDHFERVIREVESAAKTEWEMEFVHSLSAKYREYGDNMFLSEKQSEMIERLRAR